MKRNARYIILGSVIIIAAVIAACFVFPINEKQKTEGNTIVVTILPLKYIAEQIVGDDYHIDILVPPGSSPETYEPTPQQLVAVENSILILSTGLIDFEHELTLKATQSSGNKIINLSEGIDLLSGCCGGAAHSHHNHGVDPHIWTSPKQLRIMAANAYRAIALLSPDENKYAANFEKLMHTLDELDTIVGRLITDSGIKHFFIYHPALTYYANDYMIEQVSIEHEGKEPSADQLRGLIDLARSEKIDKILYQREFSRSVVETVVKDIGATPVEIDPLAENIVQSILDITHLITNRK